MKTALITGISGQDGSYLAEFLLEKGYEVHGIVRRSSTINTHRLDGIYGHPSLHLHYGDLTDGSGITRLISDTKPDEIYNLGAQSHVGVSFETPEYTAQVDALGTLHVLEAVRTLGLNSKIYQASTSELFGKVQEVPQKETTPFYPRSPYGVAKLYGYWIIKNYREAYNMFACTGILFNHETVADFTPMIFKEGIDGDIDIKPISEIVKYHTNKNCTSIDVNKMEYQETEVSNDLYVWDKNSWTKVKFASGYPHRGDKQPRYIVSKNAAYFATGNHNCIMEDGSEKEFKDIVIGDDVSLAEYPEILHEETSLSEDEAKLIGFIVGDGSLCGKRLKLTNKSLEILSIYDKIWNSIGGNTKYGQTTSGFTGKNDIWQLHLRSNQTWIDRYLCDLYDEYKMKRIPKIILNSSNDIQLAFLKGYNHADGLKSNPCVYEFKNFKTNSATLAAGLLFLLSKTTKQEYNIDVGYGFFHGKNRAYYSLNILSDSKSGQNRKNSYSMYEIVVNELDKGKSQRSIHRDTGISRTFIRKVHQGYIPNSSHHLCKKNNKVKKIIDIPEYQGWFFDLETESGTFHCGIGQGHVHNSPRRGETFVTRKITIGLNNIRLGNQNTLKLGNLNALRDWGHAQDYVRAMWLMLQQDTPDDFVIATGEQYSVKDFIQEAAPYFGMEIEFKGGGYSDDPEVGIDIKTGKVVIEVDPKYFRPTEVESLLGDSTKARTELGWEPEYDFRMLVEDMCNAEMYGEYRGT